MRWKIIVAAIIVLGGAIAAVIRSGVKRWQADTTELHQRMEVGRLSPAPEAYDSGELAHLPPPVQRYFRAVLNEGQPMIAAVNVDHSGTFNMSESGEQWQPFKSTQRVITRRPGFLWDARIQMAPAMDVFVRDAYVAGEGILTAKLFGLLTVMAQPNTPELAQGELMRFFAEGAWYPTALLPGQGVVWEAIDDTQAKPTLTDGPTTVDLLVQFDAQGLISAIRSEARYREVGGSQVLTPWEGRFWNYERRDGMLVPLDGEVAWLLPEGPHPYWRGHIERVEYEYAGD